MSRKKKPADSKGTNALPSVAAMNFWSRLKNPPPLLAFAFPEQTDVDEESLEPLLQISKVPVEESFGYSVRIELVGSNPQIWRRVLVKPVTLDILHTVIQLCMGWNDAHLHGFEIRKTRVPLGDEGARIDEKAISITQLHAENIEHFKYTYDFGVDWQHKITIENACLSNRRWSILSALTVRAPAPLKILVGLNCGLSYCNRGNFLNVNETTISNNDWSTCRRITIPLFFRAMKRIHDFETRFKKAVVADADLKEIP